MPSKWYIDDIIRRVDNAGDMGLRESAEALLDASNALVPVESGELKASGHIIERDGSYIVVYDAPHAVAVHERLDVRHPHGKAKYLEEPMHAFGDVMCKALARSIDGEVTDAD